MNKDIKLKIEKYVMDQFKYIEDLDSAEDEYSSRKSSSIKDINVLVELLQKEDMNESTSKFNLEKIKNEVTKIEKEQELNLKKLDCEIKKNKDTLDLEKEKIKKGYEIDYKKIDNDIAKIDNELVKINKDYELNNRKIDCDIDRLNQELKKINQDYELDKEKVQNEVKKNNDAVQLENRKIDNAEIKDNSDLDLKKKELDLSAKKDIELRTDRIIKVLIDGAAIVIPIIFYDAWMAKGFKFEETGTFTSSTFKNLINKFKPNK